MEDEPPLTLEEVLQSPVNPIESIPQLDDAYLALPLPSFFRKLLEVFKSFEYIVDFHSKSRNVVLFEEVRLDVARHLKRKFTRDCYLKACWISPDLLTAERMGGPKNDIIIVRLRPATGERIGSSLLPKEALERERHFLSALMRLEMVIQGDVLTKLGEPEQFQYLGDGSIKWSKDYKPTEDLEIPTFEPTAALGGHLSPIPRRGRTADSPCGPVANIMARLRSQSPLRTLRPVEGGGDGKGGRSRSRTPSLSGTPVRTRMGASPLRGVGGGNMFTSPTPGASNGFPLSASGGGLGGLGGGPSPVASFYRGIDGSQVSPVSMIDRKSPLPRRAKAFADRAEEENNGWFEQAGSPVIKRKRTTPQGVSFASSPLSHFGESAAKRSKATMRPDLQTPVPRRRGPLSTTSTPTPFLEEATPDLPLTSPLHFPLSSPVKGGSIAAPRRAAEPPQLDPLAETPLIDGRHRVGTGGGGGAAKDDTPIIFRRGGGGSSTLMEVEEEEGRGDAYKNILDDEQAVMLEAKTKLTNLSTGELSQEIYKSYFGTKAKTISTGMKDLALKAERSKDVKAVKKLLETHADRYRRQHEHYCLAKWVMRSLEETYYGKDKVPTQIRSVAGRLVADSKDPSVSDEAVAKIILFLGAEFPDIVKIEQSSVRDVQCVCLESNNANFDESYEHLHDLIEEARIGLQRFSQQKEEMLERLVDVEEKAVVASAPTAVYT
eukprot:GHVS01095152.1.p1 GENE.GHVS01095152.1~~GHVS01095152.1.p1  ORF type:complete len:718 (+),score=137.27 GHVS01095152.1:96-2249(+)